MQHPHLREGFFFAIGIDFFAMLFVKSEQPLELFFGAHPKGPVIFKTPVELKLCGSLHIHVT